MTGVEGHVFEGPAEGPEAVVGPVPRPVHQPALGLPPDGQVEAGGADTGRVRSARDQLEIS